MARAEYGPLIQQFTEDLTNVKAPLTDYIEALDSAIGELEMMKDAAEQDLEREQEGES
jgi:hypothetical protein